MLHSENFLALGNIFYDKDLRFMVVEYPPSHSVYFNDVDLYTICVGCREMIQNELFVFTFP